MTTRPGALAAAPLAVMLLMALASPAHAAGPPRMVDDAGGLPLFSGAELGPGSSQSACLTVTASGTAAGDEVTVAATDVSGALAPYLNVTIEAGSGTTGGGRCTSFTGSAVWSGTLADLGALPGDGADTGWEPTLVASRAFRITVSLISDPAAMGERATTAFAWRLVPGPQPTPTPTTDPPDPTDPPVPPPVPPVTTTPTTTTTTGTAAPVTVPPLDPGSSGTMAPGGGLTPSSVPTTRRPPKAEVTVPGLGGTPGSGGGAGPGGSGADGGVLTRARQKAAEVARQAVDVVQGLARKPQYTFGPVLLAVLFLFLQHLVDLRDPKLAKAVRTQRDLMLDFPADYDRVEER